MKIRRKKMLKSYSPKHVYQNHANRFLVWNLTKVYFGCIMSWINFYPRVCVLNFKKQNGVYFEIGKNYHCW
jgi:hypothetical protein